MDLFDRYQAVQKIYCLENGRLVLKRNPYTETWTLESARNYARSRGAEALYASCCSAEETIRFYLAMGFVPSAHPIRSCAEAEPFDIQMECRSGISPDREP